MKQLTTLLLLVFTSFLLTAGGPGKGLKVGDTAPNFMLRNIDDSFISLTSYKDVKGYVIVFTCNHCPFAVMYEDRLIELQNKYGKQGYPVIAINPNNPDIKPADSFEAMKVRAKEKGFNFDYLVDEKQVVYPAYGATKTPHVYLLDQNFVVQYIGAIDDSARDASAVTEKYLENAIEALKKGEKPDPDYTKAIGCSIKA